MYHLLCAMVRKKDVIDFPLHSLVNYLRKSGRGGVRGRVEDTVSGIIGSGLDRRR